MCIVRASSFLSIEIYGLRPWIRPFGTLKLEERNKYVYVPRVEPFLMGDSSQNSSLEKNQVKVPFFY